MKILRLSIAALLLAGFAGGVDATALAPSAIPLPTDPSLYSFADLCRLAAGSAVDAGADGTPAPRSVQGTPVSFSAAPARPSGLQAAAYVFSTGSVPQP